MANPKSSIPLYEKVFHKNTTQRALDVIILLLLLCLLFYRFISFKNHGFAWFLAFLCESCFTFIWVLIVNCKWTPLTYKTYPRRLQERIQELPPVDMFVPTADAELEPPILTVNTVLSLLAIDYPAHKLACYVSDDGCSPLTFYSLVEASKFAKLWVPFCKKCNVQVRAPFKYFTAGEYTEPSSGSSLEFQQDSKKMKIRDKQEVVHIQKQEEYERLCRNIEQAAKESVSFDLSGEMSVFTSTERSNHPAIVKAIWENKETFSSGIPHLIYISREKRPNHPHHYKAGAMNVLARVSGIMTNAPFMLNVDCDMYANNPEIVLQAMCLLLGSKNERDCGFVQSPQCFYDKPDTLAVIHEVIYGERNCGYSRTFHAGTGTFHRRKVTYGLWPDQIEHQGKIADEELLKKFGNSKEFIKSAAHALEGKTGFSNSNLLKSLDAAHQVASCGYEFGSSWGNEVGWLYGSTTEDILTGLVIHSKGWTTGYCSPNPRAFLGCAPGGPAAMRQQKRWVMGLLEILFSKHNPILATVSGNLQFRQCLAYFWILTWGLRSIPELCYVALPAYCIITNSSFLPKVQEPGIFIPVALFVIYNLYTLWEYIHAGLSVYSWWVNNCMSRIVTTSSWLFGVVNAVLKLFGLSETVFEITPKFHQSITSSYGGEHDTEVMFDYSLFFVPGTIIQLVHLAALATGLLVVQPQDGHGSGVGEYFCSVYVVLCFSPFLQGMFRKGKHGIPLSTICKSAALALLFAQMCKTSSSN